MCTSNRARKQRVEACPIHDRLSSQSGSNANGVCLRLVTLVSSMVTTLGSFPAVLLECSSVAENRHQQMCPSNRAGNNGLCLQLFLSLKNKCEAYELFTQHFICTFFRIFTKHCSQVMFYGTTSQSCRHHWWFVMVVLNTSNPTQTEGIEQQTCGNKINNFAEHISSPNWFPLRKKVRKE